MAKLFRKVVSASTLGLVGGNKKRVSSAKRQARKVGAKVGKASDKAREASGREFARPTVSRLLGAARSELGSSTQDYLRKSLR